MEYVRTGSGVLVPEAAFAEAPENREIATTADGRDVTRGFVDALDLLTTQDTVLAGRGIDLRIYEELLRDDQVAACFGQRRMSLLAAEWEVEPGGERRIDRKAAESLKAQLDEVGFDRITDRMLYSIIYGYSVGECLWARDGDEVVLADLKVRKARRFAFAPDMSLRLLTSRNTRGEALPDRKFWVVATGADNDDEPYGLGLGHQLYWPVLFKRNDIKFWLVFLEKFGMPTSKGTYPPNAQPQEKQKLLAAVRAIRSDSGIIVPEGMMIELIEAARSGTADYKELCARMDSAIAKVVLGQTASSEGTPGRLGNDELQGDVLASVVKADADLICGSFNRTVVRWLTDWNYPGAEYPRVWRVLEAPEDLNGLAERDERLAGIGYRPTAERIAEVYGDGYEEAAPPPDAASPPAAPAPDDASFAERDAERDAADVLADRLETDAGPLVDDLIEPVRRLVMEADSLEAVRDGLLELYAEMDPAELGTLMQRALMAAEMAGRFDLDAGD